MKGSSMFAAFWFVAAVVRGVAVPQNGGVSGADLQLGRKVYTEACQECHGPEGQGDGPKASELGIRPHGFAPGNFECRCTESGALPTDDDLTRVVTQGIPGTPMQAYEKTLSEVDRRAVIQYVKTLTPTFASVPPPRCINLPARPVSSTAWSVSEGKQIYRLLDCWLCHGKAGMGDGPASKDLRDEWGNPVRIDVTVLKQFKCGVESIDIYRTILTGMDGSPMPSYAKALLFDCEGTRDWSAYRGEFDASELNQLRDYLSRQPAAAAIRAMTPEARDSLVERRAWDLVHYLKSLVSY